MLSMNLYITAVSVSFNQSMYIINEIDRLLQPVLVLNNSISKSVTVQVTSHDGTATGE